MFRLLASLVLVFALFQNQADAGLTSVKFDNFTNTTANALVFNAGGFQVNRTSLGSPGTFGGGSFGAAAGQTIRLDYTITGGSFEDLFDFYKDNSPVNPKGTLNPNANAVFDGFGIDIGFFVPGTVANATINYGGATLASQAITGAGFFTFRKYLPNASIDTSFLSLNITTTSGFLTLNGVSAVPEPTSAILVGTALLLGAGGMGLRRNRRFS